MKIQCNVLRQLSRISVWSLPDKHVSLQMDTEELSNSKYNTPLNSYTNLHCCWFWGISLMVALSSLPVYRTSTTWKWNSWWYYVKNFDTQTDLAKFCAKRQSLWQSWGCSRRVKLKDTMVTMCVCLLIFPSFNRYYVNQSEIVVCNM